VLDCSFDTLCPLEFSVDEADEVTIKEVAMSIVKAMKFQVRGYLRGWSGCK
jgi:hypothetical protein